MRLEGNVLAGLLADQEENVAMVERGWLLVGGNCQNIADLALGDRLGKRAPGIVLAGLGGGLGKCRGRAGKGCLAGKGGDQSAHGSVHFNAEPQLWPHLTQTGLPNGDMWAYPLS